MGLEQVGHRAQIAPLWRHQWDQQPMVLAKSIEEFRPDYIFTEGDPPNFNRDAVLQICQDKGIPLIYWATQDPVWFKEISEYCALRADYVFTTTIELVDEYRRLGKKAHLLLFGANPWLHKKVAFLPQYQHDLVFVGSNYSRRVTATKYMLEPLVREGFDLMVWGHWWREADQPYTLPAPHYAGLLPYDQLPQVYSSAKIVLGLHLDSSSTTQTSVRTYEVLGCRAFYLTQYTKAHEHLFTRGLHLDWASSEDDLLEKARYYLNHPNIREKIASAGQAYVYTNHTVAHRALELSEALQL